MFVKYMPDAVFKKKKMIKYGNEIYTIFLIHQTTCR